MSQVKVNEIVDASGGTTASINGYTPTMSNMAGRNRIINGAMMIDQRNAGASVTPSDGQYSVDRWKARLTQASKFSVTQSNTSATGFKNSMLATSLSAYSTISTDYFFLAQVIEGFNIADLAWGTSSAQTVTLSFWVRSSLTGTFGGCVRTQASGNANYPFTFTINSANTFEYKTVTIPGPTSGNWSTDNNGGIEVDFNLGAGSSRSGAANTWDYSVGYLAPTGATSVVGTSGATFYITGVQLEAGSVATPFEHRQYGQELALAQRYYQKVTAADGGLYTNFGNGTASSATEAWIIIPLRTTMRARPSMVSTGVAANYQVLAANGVFNLNSVPVIDSNNTSSDILFYAASVAASLTSGQAVFCRSSNNTTAFIAAQAEL